MPRPLNRTEMNKLEAENATLSQRVGEYMDLNAELSQEKTALESKCATQEEELLRLKSKRSIFARLLPKKRGQGVKN